MNQMKLWIWRPGSYEGYGTKRISGWCPTKPIFYYIVRAEVAQSIIYKDRHSQPLSSFDGKFIFELVFGKKLDKIGWVASVFKGRFTLGVKAVKSWDQLNQYLSSFEAWANLKWTIESVLVGPKALYWPPNPWGFLSCLGAISRPTFCRLKYSINYWPWLLV